MPHWTYHRAEFGRALGPDEVSPAIEARERRRTRGVAQQYVALPTGEQDACLKRWESAQRTLWDQAVSERRLTQAPSYQDFLDDNEAQSKWLTQQRQRCDELRSVPRAVQQRLLNTLNGQLLRHFFQRGDAPQAWSSTSIDWPLIGFQGSGIRCVSESRLRVSKLGELALNGLDPLRVGAEILRVNIARDGPDWITKVFVVPDLS